MDRIEIVLFTKARVKGKLEPLMEVTLKNTADRAEIILDRAAFIALRTEVAEISKVLGLDNG